MHRIRILFFHFKCIRCFLFQSVLVCRFFKTLLYLGTFACCSHLRCKFIILFIILPCYFFGGGGEIYVVMRWHIVGHRFARWQRFVI